ncbi:PRP38-domain-containing protein [Sclerotinia borealis F-4128]|uniref:Pre-mRNA-splicing factor 38 n=1 Tax=Sclerotinia borealis (strain F-4128) TaxID=1432307 RepID=W9C3G0_SCLBF|nr:PRP38-domain-containing protein [Sclerotinia borealis F-4128]
MTTHRADEKRFLDERGNTGPLAPNGLNPATILEKPVRERIVDCYFWKDQCFALNEADIVSRVVSHVTFIAGTYGDSQRPSPFLCLAFKLLQLGPSDEILQEYMGYGGEKFKYLRALALFYWRMTRQAKDVFMVLEGYLEDRRKLRRKTRTGTTLTFIDQFVDELLTKDRVCGTTLWKMPKREILEDLEVLEPRISPLGDIKDLLGESEGEGEVETVKDSVGSESVNSSGNEFGVETADKGERMDMESGPIG